jgi:hypothetical protein
MDNELLEKCLENDKKAKDKIYALINETMDIAEENRIPFFCCFGRGESLSSGAFEDLIALISISEARISRNMNIPFNKLTENVVKNIQNTYIMLETQDLEREKLTRDRKGNER